MTDKAFDIWLNGCSLESLLTAWRFAPVGDERFGGERGSRCRKRLAELRDADPDRWAATSKRVGWSR